MPARENYAEGRFYSDKRTDIETLFDHEVAMQKDEISYSLKDNRIIGGVIPHAGHVFCAHQAVHFFEIVRESGQRFDTVVVVAPNHTGMGRSPMSIDSHTQWQSPLGVIDVDMELAHELALPFNEEAQRFEHSAEVILPFIQHFIGGKVTFLPINMLEQSYRNASSLAMLLKSAADKLNRKILLVASSDFTHFKSSKVGYELDSMALEPLLQFDLEEFEHRVRTMHISICGYGPIMTLLDFAKRVAPEAKVEVLKRGHSGEVYPSAEVVDYVSMMAYY
ncbi:AmmeMemoRadiSam system protein B [uncultured Acetobacteroides sp.]|uniref:AmmeMemoRadiSam system protein B n=1 Tax=uncultured Acetobacteroides sp. TaxID=1760811 RepID=UPI0029F519CD|nr:AmmeMemoRadiSam system protein B [uncultured Acetobacteroides sp.]